VPDTVAPQVADCPMVMEAGVGATVIPVMVKAGDVTVIFDEPETLVYPACAELAMQLPVPTPDGVNTPACVIVPPVAVQVTAGL
jgi:hypothetical protein